MIWTLSSGQTCGSCRAIVPVDAPLALVTTARLARCAACAPGPVDEAAIDAERHRREAVVAASREPSTPYPYPPRAARSRPVREPVPLSAIAGSLFDAKVAASGDREE